MIKFLMPVDGSKSSENAVRYLIRLARCKEPAEIHLINVRRPVDAWEVRRFLTEEEIAHTQQAEGETEMAAARALLDEAGFPYRAEVLIGPVAQTIANYANEQGCDAIVMGSHGRGELASLLMGSVATQVIHLVKIPVTLVR
ncbi:universal stress protein [Thiocystis violacea]|uniref:universal stress protein n=1 Tax=Thiocystis violacea TaxID=13725 RepID=UPI0019052576|nr:universal stress protein [Thiocystis violacea]MBK1716409.1 universal stress protein UspA [Thiocystis violacea]